MKILERTAGARAGRNRTERLRTSKSLDEGHPGKTAQSLFAANERRVPIWKTPVKNELGTWGRDWIHTETPMLLPEAQKLSGSTLTA